MIRFVGLLAAVLIATAANAQQAFVIPKDAPNTYFGFVLMPDGKIIALDNLQIVVQDKPTPPVPPAPAVEWKTDSPRVIVVDDENLRGNLPQEQVNIFTSVPLTKWMDDNGFQYRFSSNDSLVEGSEARKLEEKVWVDGWDLLLKKVKDGDVTLPAWIIGDKNKATAENLPKNPTEAIQKLEAFK